MRKEIENWWRQGKNDLEKAKVLLKKSKEYGIVRKAIKEGIEI